MNKSKNDIMLNNKKNQKNNRIVKKRFGKLN